MILLRVSLATIGVSAVLIGLAVLAIVYIVRQHKKGKCVGCPAEQCASCGHCAGKTK